MGVKFNSDTQSYTVSYGKRHPYTRVPKTMRRTGIGTKAEANRVYRELVLKVEESFKESSSPSWKQVVEECYEYRALCGQTKKTIINYLGCLKKNTFPKLGRKSIDSITTKEVRDIIMVDLSDFSKSHQKNVFKFIKSTFDFGIERGYIERNPCPNLKLKINEKLKGVLTEPQVKRLLDAARDCNSEWYYHWTLAIYTGARSSELYALTWDKVNLDSRLIQIDRAWNRYDGFKSTKSGNDRVIEIAPNLLVVLKELKMKALDKEFVLPRISLWEKGSQAAPLRTFLQALGLPPVRFHDLRATWATIMLTKGIEPIKVMSMGGWRDFKVFQKYIRKAGVNIRGITDSLDLHSPTAPKAQVLKMPSRSDL